MAELRTRRSTRQLEGRSIYFEPESDDNFEAEDDDNFEIQSEGEGVGVVKSVVGPSRPQRRSNRSNQVAGRKRSVYAEPDSDEDVEVDGEGEGAYQLAAQPSRPRRSSKRRRVGRPAKTSTRSQTQRRQQRSGRLGEQKTKKKRKNVFAKVLSTPGKVKPQNIQFGGPSDGRIPAWTSLPLEILRDVFIYASHPVHELTVNARDNVKWLMRAARTCRSFATPALEAYYQSPSLLTSLHPHNLLDIVQKPVEQSYMNYKVKVRSLHIDVTRLAYSAHNRALFRLNDLVRELPQLKHVEVIHPNDVPPYRVQKLARWRYPENLFTALDAGGLLLKSWRWSRDMIPDIMTDEFYIDGGLYQSMAHVHTSKTFEYLEKLVVCGFDVRDSAEPPAVENANIESHRPPGLASAISKLPRLKELTFISCDVVMEDFLERLPKDLERLELDNCLETTSTLLYNYLATGGSQLRELVLNNNPALNLSFLQHLRPLCPRLEVLKMDLKYYSERMNYNDAEAFYDQLLTADDVPTWPISLRHLEIIDMQKWEAESAQNFFRSLIDSAKDLPNLRRLILQAHINIPWRDRAGFRDQWIERLGRVFLRKKDGINPHLGSLKQFRLWKQSQQQRTTSAELADSDIEDPIRRRVSHVRVTPRKTSTDVEIYDTVPSSDTSKRLRTRPRRSVRVAESQSAVSTAAEEDSASSSDEEEMDDWRKQPEAFIQGLCEVVDIRIDNQRPRENQYTEANFLDSEPSGDEDWHSGAELSDDGYAW